MSEILIEALSQFKYSPNGWDNAFAQKGEEFYLPKSIVEGLLMTKNPQIKVIDEDFEPTVFSSEKEQKEIEDDKAIKALLEEGEKPSEVLAEGLIEDLEDELSDAYSPEKLQKDVDGAEDGFDSIILGFKYKAEQKSGKWYNVIDLDTNEILNKKGISRDKLGKYVADLYAQGE